MILAISGGIGNQLFQVGALLSIAEKYNWPLMIDTSLGIPRTNIYGNVEISDVLMNLNFMKPGLLPTYISRRFYNLGIKASYKKRKINKFVIELVLSVFFSFHFLRIINVKIAQDIGFSENLKFRKNSFVIGYFQSNKYISESIVNKLSDTKNWKINHDMYEKYQEKANLIKPLVVHIRLGDYTKESGIGILSEDYYTEAFKYVLSKIERKGIWIFSDDVQSARRLLANLDISDAEFVDTIKENSATTLSLMTLGSNFIVANSTFSWWAATLAKLNIDKIVVAPKPWFVNEYSPKGIYPESWVLINRAEMK